MYSAFLPNMCMSASLDLAAICLVLFLSQLLCNLVVPQTKLTMEATRYSWVILGFRKDHVSVMDRGGAIHIEPVKP